MFITAYRRCLAKTHCDGHSLDPTLQSDDQVYSMGPVQSLSNDEEKRPLEVDDLKHFIWLQTMIYLSGSLQWR